MVKIYMLFVKAAYKTHKQNMICQIQWMAKCTQLTANKQETIVCLVHNRLFYTFHNRLIFIGCMNDAARLNMHGSMFIAKSKGQKLINMKSLNTFFEHALRLK